jgi:hypothetical protein
VNIHLSGSHILMQNCPLIVRFIKKPLHCHAGSRCELTAHYRMAHWALKEKNDLVAIEQALPQIVRSRHCASKAPGNPKLSERSGCSDFVIIQLESRESVL